MFEHGPCQIFRFEVQHMGSGIVYRAKGKSVNLRFERYRFRVGVWSTGKIGNV